MRNYLYLPERFHNGHDICIDLVKQIEDVITNEAYLPLPEVQIPLEDVKPGKNEHILDFLLKTERSEEHNKIIKSHVLVSLLIDSSYFLFEALEASLRKRLTVCMALLRKPLVYNLTVLLRLIFEEGFVDRFNNDASFDPARISREDRMELIRLSLKLMLLVPFTAEEIDDWIFSKDNPESVINLSDMASHLTTNRNATILTGAQNFNFVFSGQEEIMSQWDFVYRRGPALLLYFVQVVDIYILENEQMDEKVFTNRLVERVRLVNSKSIDTMVKQKRRKSQNRNRKRR